MFSINVYDEQTGSLVDNGTVSVYDEVGGLIETFDLSTNNPKVYENDLGNVTIIVESTVTNGWTKAGVGEWPATADNPFHIWLDGVEPFGVPPTPIESMPAFPANPNPGASTIADELYMQATDVCGGLAVIGHGQAYEAFKTTYSSPWPPSTPAPGSPGVAPDFTLPAPPSPSDSYADALYALLQNFDTAYKAWRDTTIDESGNFTHLGYDHWEYLYNGWQQS